MNTAVIRIRANLRSPFFAVVFIESAAKKGGLKSAVRRRFVLMIFLIIFFFVFALQLLFSKKYDFCAPQT